MSESSRQVRRAADRKNNYWRPNEYGRLVAPSASRKCRRQNAEGRERTSCRVILAKQPRKRLSPRPASRYPKGECHAWQRKAKAYAALRELLGQSQ